MWHGRSASARTIRTVLKPLSWLYAAGWKAYLGVYKAGLKKAKEPHRPVICVGNLVVGGTGKSPITLHVAQVLQELGHDVVVSSSGYGSPRSQSATLAPAGPLDAREWGDEPAMFRWLAPELPLIVGRNRVEAARLCAEGYPGSVLLLDDGFQHLPLKKHLAIVLDPPTDNRSCLPAGPYREPWGNRSRADLVLPNGFTPKFSITGLISPAGDPVAIVSGAKVSVLCALGSPERFLSDLPALGLKVEEQLLLPDHDPLDAGNLLAPLNPNLPLVITAKDWVKLQKRQDLGARQIWIARQEARIEPEANFRSWLAQKLDELSNERPPR